MADMNEVILDEALIKRVAERVCAARGLDPNLAMRVTVHRDHGEPLVLNNQLELVAHRVREHMLIHYFIEHERAVQTAEVLAGLGVRA